MLICVNLSVFLFLTLHQVSSFFYSDNSCDSALSCPTLIKTATICEMQRKKLLSIK